MTTFVRVVELASFGRAARELGLSTSAVSKRIDTLEKQLRARLLNRTTRRVTLTSIGEDYYRSCRRILDDIEQAEQHVWQMQDEPRGRLRLAAPMDFTVARLGRHLGEFCALYPRVALDVTLADQFVDIVGGGYDAAIRIAELPDSGLVARLITTCHRILCASPDYLSKRPAPQQPADLAEHDYLEYAYQASGNQIRFRDSGDGQSMTLVGKRRANSGWLLRSLALAGNGIVLMPLFVVDEDVRAGRLVEVLPGQVDADIGVYLVRPHRKLQALSVVKLGEFLTAAFAAST